MASVPEDDISDVSHTVTVDKHSAGGNSAVLLTGVSVKLEHLTDIHEEYVLRIHAHILCKLLMLHEVVVFTVDGHEILRLCESVNEL